LYHYSLHPAIRRGSFFMSDLQFGELAAMATALLWTLSTLAWTYAGKQIGALAVAFFRPVLAGIMLMSYGYLVYGRCLPSDAPIQAWLLMSLSGVAGFVLCDLCLMKALLLIGPRLSLLIFSLAPPISAIVSWVCIGDTLTWWRWGAMGVTLTGVVWVVLERPSHDKHPHARRHRGQGVALALLAAFAHSIGYVLSKEGMYYYDDAVGATLIRTIAALVSFLVLVTLWRRWPAMLAATRHTRAMGVLALGAAVGPFVGVVLSLVALQHAPTGVVATIIATMPVLILPFSILLYHEKVSLRAVGGALVAVAGIAMLRLSAESPSAAPGVAYLDEIATKPELRPRSHCGPKKPTVR
jgi:drug/metabolite transporter (DMT)-like permease